MLSILVILPAQGEAEGVVGLPPSVEALLAYGAEDAVEKLGRNRRIDAVLLAADAENPAIVGAIRDDNPAPPPLFSVGVTCGSQVRHLSSDKLPGLVERILRELA